MSEIITIGLMGDVMIGRLVNQQLKKEPPEFIWGDLLPSIRQSDFNLINLETALTTSEEKIPKVFNFKSDPKNVQVLKTANIHMVNLANNHVLDFSEKGLLETIETLDRANIQHVGAGRDWDEAIKPAIFEIKGIKIGVFGCTDNEPTWIAKKNKPGTFYFDIFDVSTVKPIVQDIRSKVDILIASLHWGPNMRERPTVDYSHFAKELIDSGVDIIHGHSAHIFQGVEIYKGKYIFYDTGDFIDDYGVHPDLRNDHSFLFLINVMKQKLLGFTLVPVRISHFQVNHDEEPGISLMRMFMLSKELGTQLTMESKMLSYRDNMT